MTHIQEPLLLRFTILRRCSYQLEKKVNNAGGGHVIFHFRPKPRETHTHTHTNTHTQKTHTHTHTHIYIYI